MEGTTYDYEFRSGGYEVTVNGGAVELRWTRLGDTCKVERRYGEKSSYIFEVMCNLLNNGIESPKALFSAFAAA